MAEWKSKTCWQTSFLLVEQSLLVVQFLWVIKDQAGTFGQNFRGKSASNSPSWYLIPVWSGSELRLLEIALAVLNDANVVSYEVHPI